MNYALIAGLGIVLAYAVLHKGGVWPVDWNPCLIAIGTLYLLSRFLGRTASPAPPLRPVVRWLLVVLLALAVLQVLPLPLALVRVLSPARASLLDPAPRFLTLSVAPAATLGMVLTLAGLVLVFLLVRDLSFRTSRRPWVLAWPFLLIAALEGLLGVVQAYSAEGSAGLARGTYVNRNHYAGFLEMSLAFAIVQAVGVLRRGQKRFESPARPAALACLLLALATLILLGIIHSLSRGGFLSTLAALFVTALLAVGPAQPAWKRWVPIGAIAALMVVGLLYLPTDQLIARFANIAATEDISSVSRAQIWHDTRGLIAAFPWFGCGLGGYESGFLRYKTVAPMFTVDYAHNDYLQVLAESGIFGFAAVVGLTSMIFAGAVRATAAPPSSPERYLALACCGALAAMLLHSMVDFNMYIPANAMLAAWIAGLADRTASS